MAGELQALYGVPALTVYGVLVNANGQFWNTSTLAFQNYATAQLGNYSISTTEQGTASGFYKGDMPAVVAGAYTVVFKSRAGSSPAETDQEVYIQSIDWTGTAVATIAGVQADTDNIQTRLPAALVSGRMDASVGFIGLDVITTESIAANALTQENFADDCLVGQQVGSVGGDVGGKVIGAGAGDITGIGVWAAGAAGAAVSTYAGGAVASVTGSVGSIAVGGIVSTSFAANSITDAAIAVPVETAGRPSRILAMIRRLWEWQVNLRNRNQTTGDVELLAAQPSVTVLETQVQSTSGVTDTQTEGS